MLICHKYWKHRKREVVEGSESGEFLIYFAVILISFINLKDMIIDRKTQTVHFKN